MIVGLALLAVAMTGAVLFITDVLYSPVTTAVVAVVLALAFSLLWFALPLRRLAAKRR